MTTKADKAPETSARDLKWGTLAAAAVHEPPPLACGHQQLDAVGQVFSGNMRRLQWMIMTPGLVGDVAIQIQRAYDVAEVQLTGSVHDGAVIELHPRHAEIVPVAEAIFKTHIATMDAAKRSPQFLERVVDILSRGTEQVVKLSQGPAQVGLEAILASCVTGTWTAFETLAGDLWEVALNVHPAGLSELRGNRKRLLKAHDGVDAKTNIDDEGEDVSRTKAVPISFFQRHGLDLREKMGTALRERQRFDSLGAIREAYALAFYEKADTIDTILKDQSFDALNAVRNLIVHRSSIVDREYDRRSKHLMVPRAEIGAKIFLDGEIVSKMMTRTVVCSHLLIRAVHAWISSR